MKKTVSQFLLHKEKTVPILSFPSAQLLGISVKELLASAEMQAKGMFTVYDRCPVGAVLSMMDLSVEAEAFGAKVLISENEVPVVTQGIIDDIEQVPQITVPCIGDGRTQIYADGIRQAKEKITDVPVLCGCIGPYSLAGRLFDMTELMYACFDDEENTLLLLEKVTQFLISYIKAFKEAGADGVMLAEPAAGLLSPSLASRFSHPFVKRIFEAVGDENFILCYHNCGNAVVDMIGDIAAIPADVFHFGNAVQLHDLLPAFAKDKIVMGNLDPMLFVNGTPADIENEVQRIYDECRNFENFMLSSGCDIPANAKWENLDAYFRKVKELYV